MCAASPLCYLLYANQLEMTNVFLTIPFIYLSKITRIPVGMLDQLDERFSTGTRCVITRKFAYFRRGDRLFLVYSLS